MTPPPFEIVIPTLGRPCLRQLLERLNALEGPRPGRIVVVDDGCELDGETLPERVELVRGSGGGPAAARNIGWRAVEAEWVVFLDDDVLPEPDWLLRLATDLEAPGSVAASQGRICVPLPGHRRPTDWERNVRGLERARYATADMAYRRPVLKQLGGFDERFPRAFREDADLALRALGRGYTLEQGARTIVHPVRPAGFWTSVSLQAGNADDVLMRVLHGPDWRERVKAPRGSRRVHLAITAAGVLALGALFAGRRRLAAAAGLAWFASSAELAFRRIRPGPRTAGEVIRMAVTSAAIPPAAALHTLAAWARLPHLLHGGARQRPAAVLLDRDGTLVEDVPYNGDPARVVPLAGAREALDRLRAAGLPLAVISNQSGIGRGLLAPEQVEAVNRRVEQLLGPVDTWLYCPHEPEDGCGCRKPAPGLIVAAALELGVEAARCAVVGDIGSDVEAAQAVGARGVLVPTWQTRPEEIVAAPEVARDLSGAIDLLIGAPK